MRWLSLWETAFIKIFFIGQLIKMFRLGFDQNYDNLPLNDNLWWFIFKWSCFGPFVFGVVWCGFSFFGQISVRGEHVSPLSPFESGLKSESDQKSEFGFNSELDFKAFRRTRSGCHRQTDNTKVSQITHLAGTNVWFKIEISTYSSRVHIWKFYDFFPFSCFFFSNAPFLHPLLVQTDMRFV